MKGCVAIRLGVSALLTAAMALGLGATPAQAQITFSADLGSNEANSTSATRSRASNPPGANANDAPHNDAAIVTMKSAAKAVRRIITLGSARPPCIMWAGLCFSTKCGGF